MSLFFALLLVAGFLCLVFAALLFAGSRHERDLFAKGTALRLERPRTNPTLSPDRDEDWEAGGVFNPAAWYDGEKVHLFYRAVGADGVSRLGYASSTDGLTFSERLPYPIFSPRSGFGIPKVRAELARQRGYDPERNPSGWGWAGIEDPRATAIGDRVYLTFTAFDGWGFVRMAFTSLESTDIWKKRWNWRVPVFLSPPNEIHKNWVIFPEKIRGKFAVLHSVSPSVEIAYVDDLERIGSSEPYIESRRGPRGCTGTSGWDSSIRGVGPSPIKTTDGWLVLYHAMDKRDPDRYKLGALLLSLDDPTRIIARAPEAILAPDMWYENDGKPGVVYACGAIVKDGELYVYYGGGDKHVCVAHTPIAKLLMWMKGDGQREKLV